MNIDDEMNKTKRAELTARLERGERVLVMLDPRLAVVPLRFKERPDLTLELGYDLPVPINGLLLSAAGISGSFSFNRAPFYCNIPWRAVFCIGDSDGRALRWAGHEPPELKSALDVAGAIAETIAGERIGPPGGGGTMTLEQVKSAGLPIPPAPAPAPVKRRPSREVLENRMRARGLRVVQ